MGYGYGMGGMALWWLFGLLLVVGLVLLSVLVIRVLAGGTSGGPSAAPGPPPSRAREILDERYARGEVSTEEYQERLRSLDERS